MDVINDDKVAIAAIPISGEVIKSTNFGNIKKQLAAFIYLIGKCV